MLVPGATSTAIAAASFVLCGIGVLYASWRKWLRPRPLALAAGWALIAASAWLWLRFGGAEFGPVLAALNLSILALLVVLSNRHVRRGNGRLQEPVKSTLPRAGAVARHLAVFAAAVPLAGSAAVLALIATARFLPWSEVDRLALVLLAVPVLWGGLAAWAASDPWPGRPVLGLGAGALLAAAVAFL